MSATATETGEERMLTGFAVRAGQVCAYLSTDACFILVGTKQDVEWTCQLDRQL